MKEYGIIVDGYSSGKFYHEYFRSVGIPCFHLQSKPNIPEFVKGCFCSGGYAQSFVNEDINQTIDRIKQHGTPKFIIPGCELGVNLADELSNAFQLPLSNALNFSAERRNKFLMQETIKKSGLRSIIQGVFRNSESAVEWISQNKIAYPVVVKPTMSTSGDGFHLCQNIEGVKQAFEEEINRKNLLNIENIELLVQEYILGTEYVVDTVSLNGEATVSDIIRYEKRIGKYGNTVYEKCTFLSIDLPELQYLIEYTCSVLNALGILNGPAHTEIIIDEKGPVLIETGARPAGCMLDLDFIRNAYGHNQLELSGLLYRNIEEYKNQVNKLNNQIKVSSEIILFAHREKGKVKSIDFTLIEQSSVYKKTDLKTHKGALIDEPKNLSEIHAIIYLQGENQVEMQDLSKALINQPERFIELEEINHDLHII